MTNPTKSELLSSYSSTLDSVLGTGHSGPCTNEEIGTVITAYIEVFNTLDPDRKITIRQVTYDSI